MNFLRYIKKLLFLFLTFLLGAQPTHAKTEVTLPQNQVVFAVVQNKKINSLQKTVPPNIGFLKEKTKFVAVQGSSAVNSYTFSESFVSYLAGAGAKIGKYDLALVKKYFKHIQDVSPIFV